jgi:hypothetical protein
MDLTFVDFRLVIDKDTGYFNATKLCIEGGKNYFEWNRLKKSKDMIIKKAALGIPRAAFYTKLNFKITITLINK